MSSNSFRFQQFEVFHDRCGMKVGTDGVLLGAWVQTLEARRILDVGTGSGLIALILAQHSEVEIIGIEFDAAAAEQADENARNSPWPHRINMVHKDFRTYQEGLFDLIVSNPPFFQNALHAPAPIRNQARHDVTLSYEELISKASTLLTQEGRLAVIIPSSAQQEFEDICWSSKLYLKRCCEVSTLEGQAPKRVLLEFSRKRVETERTTLVLGIKGNARSDAYSALTFDLYL
jgi:tRNA1Val (adenine37-N6)-methyltransferase